MTRSLVFASDNYASVHPNILQELAQCCNSVSFAPSYGSDPITTQCTTTFKTLFDLDCSVYYVFNGTAANVLSLSACLKGSYNAVLAVEGAHIVTDECGAFESLTGAKIICVPSINGKLTIGELDKIWYKYSDTNNVHSSQPSALSISQLSELGTAYTPSEVKALADWAHERRLFLHMDGARLSNAAASLNLPFKAFTVDCGVDVLSFGGTKNGLMYGEAIIAFNKDIAGPLKYLQKQYMQLASKNRFISAQFTALLTNDLWLTNATHANQMARSLLSQIKDIATVLYPVDGNEIFVQLSKQIVDALHADGCHFYVWDEKREIVRFVTSFSTTQQDVDAFAAKIKDKINADL